MTQIDVSESDTPSLRSFRPSHEGLHLGERKANSKDNA